MAKVRHLREVPPHSPLPPGARPPDQYCGSTHDQRFTILRDVMSTTNPLLQKKRFDALFDLLLLSMELDKWQNRE